MATRTEIMNLALNHLGISKKIVSETERSAEANAMSDLYNTSRDKTLADFPWPFATAFINLSLVLTDPTTEWSFSYRYPSDCLAMRKILSGVRNDDRQTRVPFKIGLDAQGILIYTDAVTAVAEYTMITDDVTRYPADFKMALSFLLAFYAAPRLTQGDPFKLGQRAFQMYGMEIRGAQSTSANEEAVDPYPESEFIRSREDDTIA